MAFSAISVVAVYLSITHQRTCHGTEPKTLFCIIVCCGPTPFHAISASLCGTVSVVSPIIQEGELAQSTIRVTASCCHNYCEKKNKNLIIYMQKIQIQLLFLQYTNTYIYMVRIEQLGTKHHKHQVFCLQVHIVDNLARIEIKLVKFHFMSTSIYIKGNKSFNIRTFNSAVDHSAL